MMYTDVMLDDFTGYCRNLDGFDAGGKAIEIDGTDFRKNDFETHIETALRFLKV
jgi:hypothetical protein